MYILYELWAIEYCTMCFVKHDYSLKYLHWKKKEGKYSEFIEIELFFINVNSSKLQHTDSNHIKNSKNMHMFVSLVA